ncbi:MAG: hypothetical protein WAL68_09945 [Candidatus Binatus sp.]
MRRAQDNSLDFSQFAESSAPFDFEGINLAMPTRTFERRSDLRVGSKTVCLIEVGPAHTRGDI